MGVSAFVHSFKTFGRHTESAGTIIQENIQGKDGHTAAMLRAAVTTGATAHTLSFMYAEGTGTRTTASAAAAAGQKVLNVTDAPKDPAGNATASGDVIAYQLSDGTWQFDTVDSLSTKAITLTTNIGTAAVLEGAKVRIFGVIADGAVFTLTLTASGAPNSWGDGGDPIIVCPYVGDPMVVQIDNATNASVLEHMLWAYINKSAE